MNTTLTMTSAIGNTIAMAARESSDAADAPEWVQLLPDAARGINTFDGRGPYRVTDPAAVIAASFASDPRDATGLILDENHAYDKAAPLGFPSPARGEIVTLESRPGDGIWGRVNWTQEGRAMVRDGAYRGISPVFMHDKQNNIVKILRASLVNGPNLRGLAPLHMESKPMTLAERLAEKLGQPLTASDDDLLSAIPDLGPALQTMTAQMAEIGTVLGVDGGDGAAILAAARGAKSTAPAEMAAMQAELTNVTTAFTALQNEVRRERAVAFVDAAIAEARPGVKPRRDAYIARHMQDPAGTEADINAIPSFRATQTTTGSAMLDGSPPDLTALSAEQQGRALHDRAIVWQSEQRAKGLTVSMFEAITHVNKDAQL